MTDKATQIRVTGRVQGVNYRAWTRAEALSLGLHGWVRNCDDGSVRALVAGPAPAVDELLRRMHDGPGAATVTDVSHQAAAAPDGTGFEIVG